MVPPVFDSFSQNGEDVVLWRALGHIRDGRYIDVGANHPSTDSVSMAFYQAGWSGITVEPDPHFAGLQRRHRPRDLLFEAAAGPEDGATVTLHVVDGTGLSSTDPANAADQAAQGRPVHDVAVPVRRLEGILDETGWGAQDIHFMSVDTEGSEAGVLAGIDLAKWRPWVMVVEATAPNSTRLVKEHWERTVLDGGYQLCLFDGLSCFYVADEHRGELGQALSYPACVLDNYTTWALRQARDEARDRAGEAGSLRHDLVWWRGQATGRWASAMSKELLLAQATAELEELKAAHQSLEGEHRQLEEANRELQIQLSDVRSSSSWKMTRPLRAAGHAAARARSRLPGGR